MLTFLQSLCARNVVLKPQFSKLLWYFSVVRLTASGRAYIHFHDICSSRLIKAIDRPMKKYWRLVETSNDYYTVR